jgi:hypothetical protein
LVDNSISRSGRVICERPAPAPKADSEPTPRMPALKYDLLVEFSEF